MGRAKKREESETLELEDRISNLPENLIVHILSLLPTKHAVGTSALSKFWKNQWTSVPNLDFDDSVLMTPRSKIIIYVQPSFVVFVRRVMNLHKTPQICQFRLKSHQYDFDSHLNTYISTSLARNVKRLELELICGGQDSLPCEIFTSSTLEELKLGSPFLLNIPNLVCLPNLRAIYLHYVKFADYESSKRLFSSCPSLEDLTIIYSRWCNEIVLNISSPTVKRLVVDSSCSQFPIKLNTPRLEHFNYVGQLAEGFLPKSPEFLAEVYFHTHSYFASKQAIKVLAQGISNVQFLYLSGEILETLKEPRLEFQTFHNLRTLVIGYNRNGAWKMLPQLLEKCPNLKRLELNDGLYGQESRKENFRWFPPKVVPACLLLHLERIIVHAFKGDAGELRMIQYLLINARVLKKLTIKSALGAQKERTVRKKLLAVKRANGLLDCEVVVS